MPESTQEPQQIAQDEEGAKVIASQEPQQKARVEERAQIIAANKKNIGRIRAQNTMVGLDPVLSKQFGQKTDRVSSQLEFAFNGVAKKLGFDNVRLKQAFNERLVDLGVSLTPDLFDQVFDVLSTSKKNEKPVL